MTKRGGEGMKIVCDCGAELRFIPDGDIDEDDGQYVTEEGSLNIEAEHDQCWITCKKCKKAIWMFT